MKIIRVDNFNREHISDYLVCDNVSEHYGKILVDQLNTVLSGPHSQDYFRLVEDDYVIYKFDPNS